MKTKNLFLFSLLIASAGMLSACSNINPDSIFQNPTTENLLGKQSLSVVSLLNNDSSGLLRKMLATSKEIPQDEVDNIKKILAQVDTILENRTGIVTTEMTSDLADYESALKVTYTDLFNQSSSYTLYFNKVENITPTRDRDDHDDEDEKETVTFLRGILKDDSQVFNFESKVTDEIEGDEKETEVHFRLYNDAGFYILAEVENESETDEVESEIKYTVFDGQKVVTTYSLETEVENNKNPEIKLKINDKRYKIEQIKSDNREFLKVKYSSTTSNAAILFEKVITIDQTTGIQTVEFIIVE